MACRPGSLHDGRPPNVRDEAITSELAHSFFATPSLMQRDIRTPFVNLKYNTVSTDKPINPGVCWPCPRTAGQSPRGQNSVMMIFWFWYFEFRKVRPLTVDFARLARLRAVTTGCTRAQQETPQREARQGT